VTVRPFVVEVDKTTAMFVKTLVELLAEEPAYPHADLHEGHEFHEVADRHWHWQRQVNACRLMIGVRMTNNCVEEYR
jgi:hypothetical protein